MKNKTEIFIGKANNKHGSKYDYSYVSYINSKIKVKIVCLKHGEFEQKPNDHLTGNGCSLCGNKNLSLDSIIEKGRIKHGDKYDYSNIEFVNNKTKINIKCPIHGEFKQRIDHHLAGAGCPVCKESRGEREIKKILNGNNIEYVWQKRFKECRDKKPLPFDFYLPNENICIEFNGRQHYIPVEYWGGAENLIKQKIKDDIKINFCKKNNISLIIITDIKEIKQKLKWLMK
jgi:hypothetical protein